jgi:hypothetical protein
VACICFIATPSAAAWIGTFISPHRETPRTEIYRGVYYSTYRESFGAVHLVEVDLTRPGIDLHLTPLESDAVAAGYQYRLDYVRNAARAEGLAVAINGPFFSADSYVVPMVGDFARGVESIVADHRISHLNPLDYMLWFDDQLTPHVDTSRPTLPATLRKAKWAVGGRALAIRGAKPRGESARDKLACLGVDTDGKRLWLGVFESATDREANEVMMRAGAQYVMGLDGGDSTSLYLGGRAHGVAGGLRFGGQRPVATIVGIRADPIVDPL